MSRSAKFAARKYVSVLCILIVGAALRLYRLADRSLWIDEIYSIRIRGTEPVREIFLSATLDSHPPLHYVILHYWMEVFGNSVLATRIQAVLIGMAGILALYLLGAELFEPRVGLIAASLLAVSPMHVNASRTVRMYGLLTLLAILSTYFFVLAARNYSYRTVGGYVISTILLLWTHPYAVFVVVAHNIYVVTVFVSNEAPRRLSFSLPRWTMSQGVIALWAFPGVARMLELAVGLSTGATGGLVSWMPDANRYHLLETLLYYSGLPSYYPYIVDATGVRLVAVTVALLAIGCIGVAFGEYGRQGSDRGWTPGQIDGLYLLSLLMGSAIVLPFAISKLLRPVYHINSTIVGLFAFFLIVALGASKLPAGSVRTLCVVVLIGGLFVSSGFYLSASSTEPWNDAARHVESDATESDLVVFNPQWIDTSYKYYADGTEYETTGISEEFSPRKADELRMQVEDRDRVWVVSRFTPNIDHVTETIGESHTVRSHDQYGELHVYLFVDIDGGDAGTGDTDD